VHVSQQVLDLLVGHDLAEAFHFGAAVLDDVGDAVVVGGESAEWKILVLENALHAGTFFAAGGIGFVAAVAIIVVEFAARGLLRVEAEFGIGLAPLDIAGSEGEQGQDRDHHGGTGKAIAEVRGQIAEVKAQDSNRIMNAGMSAHGRSGARVGTPK